MESKVSGHWTDEQLIAHLYGIAPVDDPKGDHLRECNACQGRQLDMQSSREALDRTAPPAAGISGEFLAAQRRQIYAKMAQPVQWWSGTNLRRWASAGATLLVLGGGLMVYEEHQEQELMKDQVSDAQLAAQVSSMTQSSEPSSTAPLEALFEE